MTASATSNASVAPWLTVIMPVYRGEEWIAASLQSLVDETPEGVEVIVIDSSPTPATRDIARSYAHRLRLLIIERSDLSSWHTKTNFGVEIAASSHVCWLGVDDVWLPGRLAAVKAWIEAAASAPLHLAPSAIIDRLGRKLGIWRCPLPAHGQLPPHVVTARLLVQNFIAAPAPVFRRDAWLACGGLDEQLWYTADWDIWLKLSAVGPVYYHDIVTVGFRIHSGSLTVTGSRDTAKFSEQMRTVLERHLGELKGDALGVERAARASIAVNTAFASASGGNLGGLLQAAFAVLRLGPSGIHRYFRDSRIVERVVPRVRAKLAGVY
jgi:glycosyltransferase involved in cell wall biosynthesis